MFIMLSMMFTLSTIFMFMKHPMSLGTILLIQTILVTLITGINSLNFWFSYMLFLIMIGGMLILFIYMTNVASNEKFKFSNKIYFMVLATLLTYLPLYFIMDSYFMLNKSLNMINFSINMNMPLSKFFNFPYNLMMITIIIYLFITLIAVVKITDFNNGPLRQKN
uniref:NADH-ubiquinone oxidoreductase chain 6 n=1 Tax=Cucujoidea sp. 23 KM-2017 TaxID=2219360 RepID=A0A346RI31_9CUCU|nr:NADH dehydrogenase subunit 6 [Cucujoidea sp. 23 KM-2017]